MVQLAGDGFDVGAGFGRDEGAAVERGAAPDQLVDARDRPASGRPARRRRRRPAEPRRPRDRPA